MSKHSRQADEECVLVTGGSEGIGEAICNALAEGGSNVGLTRSEDRRNHVQPFNGAGHPLASSGSKHPLAVDGTVTRDHPTILRHEFMESRMRGVAHVRLGGPTEETDWLNPRHCASVHFCCQSGNRRTLDAGLPVVCDRSASYRDMLR